MQNWSDKDTSDQVLELKLFQKLFKIQPQGVQMASKIHSGGLLGGQAKKRTFSKASRTPQAPLLGGHLGIQNPSKPVPEAFPRRMWLRTVFWNGFGTHRVKCLCSSRQKTEAWNTSIWPTNLWTTLGISKDIQNLSQTSALTSKLHPSSPEAAHQTNTESMRFWSVEGKRRANSARGNLGPKKLWIHCRSTSDLVRNVLGRVRDQFWSLFLNIRAIVVKNSCENRIFTNSNAFAREVHIGVDRETLSRIREAFFLWL